MCPVVVLWPSYEGANDWKVVKLLPKTVADAKGARESLVCVLSAIVARMSLMICTGEVGVVGTSDEAALGYYVVIWLSEPYTLQEDKEGMAGVIKDGTLVVDAEYFNRVARAPHWYTPSPGNRTVVEVAHVLRC